jgi:hypothetical protein
LGCLSPVEASLFLCSQVLLFFGCRNIREELEEQNVLTTCTGERIE